MNRYDIQNASRRIDGYCAPRQYEEAQGKQEEAFERAKLETIGHMRKALEQTEQLTADQFYTETRYKRG